MVKPKKTGVVPKLRFPEFREAGEWPLKLAGQLFHNRIERGTEGLPIYSVTTDSGMVRRSSLDRKIDDLANSEGNKKVCKSDIAYNMMRMWQGAFGIAPEDCMVSPAYVVLAPQIGVSSDFYGQFLKTSQSLKRLASQSHGLTEDRLRLYYKDFAQIPLMYPIPEEQQKTADCLTSLDELIAAQGRKVEALKIYKRCLMQQLFPREGKSVPRLRFPEFRDAPGWEERTLSNICRRIMDGTHFSPKTKEGPCPYLTSKNIRNGYLDLSTVSYISEEEHREIYARCPVKKGDVLLTKDGANTGNCAINTLEYEFSLLSSVAVLCGDKAVVSQDFLYQVMVAERTQSAIINSMSGQAITRITLEKLGSYVIPLPSLAEQERIAVSLSLLDKRILVESDKFTALQSHKQALMQQLFPAVEESEA